MSDRTITSHGQHFQRTVSACAQITAANGVSATAALWATFPRYEPSELTFRGIVTEGSLFELWGPETWATLQVEGKLPSGDVLRLSKPWLKRIQENEFQVECNGFTLGDESPPPFNSGKLYVAVRVPAVEVLRIPSVDVQHGLGSIESSAKWEDAIIWDSGMGRFLIANCYHLDHLTGPQEEMSVQVPVGELNLESEMPSGAKPLEIMEHVEALVEKPLWILSFLARKILLWYEIEVTILPPPYSGDRPVSLLKRRDTHVGRSRNRRPILLQRQLRGVAFGSLVDALASSPAADWLLRATIYCIAANEKGTVETELAMTLLAAESLCNGFRRIQKKVGGSGGGNALWEKLRDLVLAKGVRTDDLWPATTSLTTGLEEAAKKTRNEFIHEARINDLVGCLKNTARIRIITERGILKILGWQDDAFHYDAFVTDWLRQGI